MLRKNLKLSLLSFSLFACGQQDIANYDKVVSDIKNQGAQTNQEVLNGLAKANSDVVEGEKVIFYHWLR